MSVIDWLVTVGLCMAPVSELRGGLPYAAANGAHPAVAYVVCVLANLIPVVPVMLGLTAVERILARWTPTRRAHDWVAARTRRKGRVIERLGAIGLVLLVAVPLPGTGAWTGALAAVLLGWSLRRSVPLITLGVLIAGGVVLCGVLLGVRLLSGAA